MKIGFIGLGNVGLKLAGSLVRNGFLLKVNDLNRDTAHDLIEKGEGWAETPMELVESSDLNHHLSAQSPCSSLSDGKSEWCAGRLPEGSGVDGDEHHR